MHSVVTTEADIVFLVTVAHYGRQTSDVADLASMIEHNRERLDETGVAKMFQTLVTTCLDAGEIRLAYETFSRMLNAGVPRDISVDELELKLQNAEKTQGYAATAG